jgi:hypothetical protein
MKKLLFLLVLLTSCSFAWSQDTTWVQTFTYDSISTRRANFEFPESLNDKRFEKVLMYYKLKCSPLTPWDQYDCGEWDYLTYTRVFDHTGQMDSVAVNGSKYLVNTQAPTSLNYNPLPFTQVDTYTRTENNRSNAQLTTLSINAGAANAVFPFNVSNHGGRYQMLLTSSELNDAGIVPGNLQSLSLFVNAISNNGELKYPKISLKTTNDNVLSGFHSSGFTEVYNASRWFNGSAAELTAGQNQFLFYQPFLWNGTDNIIIEFYFENSIAANNGLTFQTEQNTSLESVYYDGRNGCMSFNASNYALTELSDFVMGSAMTISFWAKGTGTAGTNTSVLEAYDVMGNRTINIHLPWSNNRLYFDAGNNTGFDRIDKEMTANEMDDVWNHWAFVKNQATGMMSVYKNGVLWHSGTNLTRDIGYIHRLVLGSNANQGYFWNGKIDEFQIFNEALSANVIQEWMTKKPDQTHPNWSNLMVYYDFDNTAYVEDQSANDFSLMPSQMNMIQFNELPNAGINQINERPVLAFGQGDVNGAMLATTHPEIRAKEPVVVYELEPVGNHFAIVSSFIGLPAGNETSYNVNGTIASQVPFTGANNITNLPIVHYHPPYEIIHDVEIARYITPYGINFSLGSNGFTWIYDVTDYHQYLRGIVDLAAHNTQELIDLRFAFIEGIPPRDVHSRQPIWENFRSYQYSQMDNNTQLSATSIALADSSSMFKIKTRLTGHGHHGSVNCCEWDPKDHYLFLDGTLRYTWDIWEETACGDSPNPGQGGTWPYAREGWCPGDQVKEYEFDITPHVTPGGTVSIDYDIEDIPANDQAQGNGNYIAAFDLISYSAPNFQNDAAVVDVLNPNKWEYYRKWNPSCSNPRVVIQNTGAQDLTQCIIRIWISYGDWVEYNWTGNLKFLEKQVVEIPIIDLGWWRDYHGEQTFHAQVYAVQGYPDLDEYANNNYFSTKFNAPKSINTAFYCWFKTNNKAHENKYKLLDANGNVIFERNNMANTTEYKDTFDLAPGCYSIVIEDSDSDGIGFWYSSQVEGETSGFFRLRKVSGSYIDIFPTDWGNYYRYDFSVGFALSVEEIELTTNIQAYPNPTNSFVMIEVNGQVEGEASLEVFDMSGRMIQQMPMNASASFAEAQVDLSAMQPGNYIVRVQTKNGVYSKMIVKV